KRRQPIVVTLRPAILDLDVLALDIACFFQSLPERAQAARVYVGRCAAEKSDHRHPALLRARRQRPSSRAAEKRDERTTSHSITSSARNRRVGKGALIGLSAWAKPVPGPDRGSCVRHSPSKKGVNALLLHAAAPEQTILPTLRLLTRPPRRCAAGTTPGSSIRAPWRS